MPYLDRPRPLALEPATWPAKVGPSSLMAVTLLSWDVCSTLGSAESKRSAAGQGHRHAKWAFSEQWEQIGRFNVGLCSSCSAHSDLPCFGATAKHIWLAVNRLREADLARGLSDGSCEGEQRSCRRIS